jgi:hypothetical protein
MNITRTISSTITSLLLLTASHSILAKTPSPEDVSAARQLFTQINSNDEKGAFGLNSLQGAYNRTTVVSGKMPKGGVVFQAAFRIKPAEKLVLDYGLYTGNLFSTNLFELIGEFVYQDRNKNHNMPVDKLYKVGAEAFPTASLMTKNWVIEKHYTEVFPETGISHGFFYRGIAGAEFEEPYAREFLNYYLNFMQNENEWLPIYMLAKKSPLVQSSDLQEARNKIGETFSYFENYYKNRPKDQPKVVYLKKIRNNIHNQLTPEVIPMIDHYLKEVHPDYQREFGSSKRAYILTVRSLLVSYFKVSFSKIKKQVQALPGQKELLNTVNRLIKNPHSPKDLLKFSDEIASLREQVATLKIKPRQKYRILTTIKMGTHALGVWPKQENAGKHKEMIPAMINSLYAEGLLTLEQKNEAIQSAAAAGDFDAALMALEERDVLGNVLANIGSSFDGVLDLWIEVQPDKESRQKMEYFSDNTIKSSDGASALFFLMDKYLAAAEKSSPTKAASASSGSAQGVMDKVRVLNAGSTCGKLAYLTDEDMQQKNDENLSRNQIPVFEIMPIDLTTVAGTITLVKQPRLGHIQIKSKNRGTPNLDLSPLGDGNWDNEFLKSFKNHDCVHMELGKKPATVVFEHIDPEKMDSAKLSEEIMQICRQNCLGGSGGGTRSSQQTAKIELVANLDIKKVISTRKMSWKNYQEVGSKSANYAELAHLLNTEDRTVVRYGMGIPFYFYKEFIDSNPKIKSKISSLLKDPKMTEMEAGKYRKEQLAALREMFFAKDTRWNEEFLASLIDAFDTFVGPDGNKRAMKLRSSTNSEDLPQFNGAGLYTSKAYKPYNKKGEERDRKGKVRKLKKTLATVWASVWTQRAFDERAYFGIHHEDVYMGIQVNPNFPNEELDGVIVTKDIYDADMGPAISIEAQRGNKYSVANPLEGALAEQILVTYNADKPLDRKAYKIHIIRKSNVAKDGQSVLSDADIKATPLPNVMTNDELNDLAYFCLKAQTHFKKLFKGDENFAMDLEFKVDKQDTGKRAVYLKQARPLIEPPAK